MINIPLIKSVESALSVYYTYPQLKNTEIKEVFGHLSNAKVCQLKELAREKMNELEIPLWNATAVDTNAAYQAWGLNVNDLERRYAKMKKMEITNGEEHSRTEKGV